MAASLLETWIKLVRAHPDALALVEADGARTWTRASLATHAESWLAALPVSVAGQRVTFALPNGPGWFTAFLGLLQAGAIPVPLDPSEPANTQRNLAISARATFAWINGRLESIAPSVRAKKSPVCLIKLTSGSTGNPRALAFTHRQMLADGRQVCVSMGITSRDINFAVIPFGHSYGLGNLVVPLLAQGTPIVCAGVPLPHVLAANIARWRPTVFPAVPALLRVLANADLPSDALSCLHTIICAGAPLHAEIAQAFHAKFSLRPHGFYGSSETGGIAYDRSGDATLAGRSVGTPLEGVMIAPARGGRIRVTSPAVGRTGSFSPADRATLTVDGEVVLHGRTGRLVKIAGRRLDLGELEKSLRQLPGIRDAFISPHPQTPDELAAILATTLRLDEVRALLRSQLAAWKIPRRLVVVADFPLTARGKTDTKALRALLNR